ncbi:unnamed protein product [Fusarium graminearum]|uniref:Uncharacterized protein n=1 Tax=Gibberella zeae TaxID=5518 RepID=A0A4E9DV13_GIBZA
MTTNVARRSPSCPPVRNSSNLPSFFIQHRRQSKPRFCASETGPLPTEKPTPTTARDHFLDDAWSMNSVPFNPVVLGSSWTKPEM